MKKLNNIKYIVLIIVLSSINMVFSQETQMYFPPESGDAAGVAADIVTANGKVFVYTTTSVLVYDLSGNTITTIPFHDSNKYSKFAPHYFWPEKYLADFQFMTYNSNNNLLYVLTPELNIEIINTSLSIPTAEDNYWEFDINIPLQKPMHGFAILKYDNIRNRLFFIYNFRKSDQDEYSFHSRSVYFSVSTISNNGLTKTLDYSEIFAMDQGPGYNETIFDVEFNDITNPTDEKYNEFYLARRYIVQTCEIIPDGNNNILNIISKYPELNYDSGGRPVPLCPNPGKFTKLLYIHDGDIHKLVAIPYKMPVLGNEPDNTCDIKMPIVDLDNSQNNQSIIAPHRRITDVYYLNGNSDLIMCFGDRDEFFNHSFGDTYYDYDMAIVHYDASTNRYDDDTDNFTWINSNIPANGPDDFVKLNIPLKIEKNYANPDNSFFLCKSNEIVRFDYSNNAYNAAYRYQREGAHFFTAAGSESGSNTYILNLAASGFEIFNSNAHTSSVQSGFQALCLCPDTINRKLYVYNNLNIASSEVFISDLNQPDADAVKLSDNGFLENSAIGKIIYNQNLNQILISRNSNTGGIIVFDALSGTPIAQQPSSLQNAGSYIRDMFISPLGKLYVLTNSRNQDPVIKTFDAVQTSYPEVDNSSISLNVLTQPEFTTYNADFCYNPYKQNVYAIVSTNNTVYDPYFTTSNSEDASDKNIITRPYRQSLLVDIDNAAILKSDIQMGRQIICPESENVPDGYQGELIINAGLTDDAYNTVNGLLLFDCSTNTFTSYQNYNLNQICFYEEGQKLYGLQGPQQLADAQKDVTNFYQFDFSPLGGLTNVNNFGSYDGQVLNIFTNPYDQRVYIQTRLDAHRLGALPMQLISYNINDINNGDDVIITDLANRGHYVELDRNPEAMYFYYPVTKPYIDQYQNKIYLPNGGHSNVSRVEFNPIDFLNLHFDERDQYAWLSIPRNSANQTTSWEEFDNVEDVCKANRFDNPYTSYFSLIHQKADGDLLSNTWTLGDWTHDPNPNNYSVRGYKMTMDDLNDNVLHMYGQIKYPTTTFPVYKDSKNWIGYFLLQEQNVLDAMQDHIDYIDEIWGEDFYCYRPNGSGIIFGPDGGDFTFETPATGPEWACSKRNPNVKYGDMIIINPTISFDGVENPMFYWSNGGLTQYRSPRPEPVYFIYTETDTYKPFIIELDTINKPDEIGAFVGDSCVGACSVIPADTAVILRAYIASGQEDSVTFNYHYYTKSNANKRISSYTVLNEEKEVFEKRMIKTTEGNERAFVSFKIKNDSVLPKDKSDNSILVWPNPTHDNLNYSFSTEINTSFKIMLYDIQGKKLAVLKKGISQKGLNSGNLKFNNKNQGLLKPGIYFVRIEIGNVINNKKLIIN